MRREALFRSDRTGRSISALPLVEIAGDQRVLIERHKGVLGYDRQRICVKLSFGLLTVNGCNLEITHMSKVQLVITGRIQEVVFRRSNS